MGNPCRGARLDAIQHINEIQTKKFSIGKKLPNPLTLDLHHAVSSLSAELYQKDIHFLMELIQVFCFYKKEYPLLFDQNGNGPFSNL